jgi:hypothetical protein
MPAARPRALAPALPVRVALALAVRLGAAALCLAALLGCDPGGEGQAGSEPGAGEANGSREGEAPADSAGADLAPAPSDARPDVVETLRADRDAPRHPADGGGRAWLEAGPEGPPRAVAGQPGRFHLVYQAGPLGIARGGAIQLQVSPFWGWSTPQTESPEAPGYTRVEPDAQDLDLEVETLDRQLLGIRLRGRALAAGERIRIVYGAGPAGASADRFAERASRFWFGVDGDGDGVRAILPDSPSVEVEAGPPAQLLLTLPTTLKPGASFRAQLAVLDAAGNTGVAVEGEVLFEEIPAGLELPARVALRAGQGGRAAVDGLAREPGIYRLSARGPAGLAAESNPLVVGAGPRVLWGDLHGHSGLSDGTGTPEDYFVYARDVAGLDVAALTDHDHWGILPLETHPALFEEIARETRRFHEPGRFVTILGWEWTSWIHGHRHVLHFEDEGRVLSSLDERYQSPPRLWQALEGRPALTFAHHSAGGPIATNWEIPPDPRFEPVTEVASVHGSSEARDTPLPIYRPLPGNFVRDALGRGYRLGFIGSGDSHDGHPGLPQLAAPSGGLAAIVSEELTREGVLSALRARRVYATNGPRILLRTALAGHPMGSNLPAPPEGRGRDELFAEVVAPGRLERLDLVRSGELVDSLGLEGQREVRLHRPLEGLRPGEYVYLRAVQEDGGAAWSSPIFVEAEAP